MTPQKSDRGEMEVKKLKKQPQDWTSIKCDVLLVEADTKADAGMSEFITLVILLLLTDLFVQGNGVFHITGN